MGREVVETLPLEVCEGFKLVFLHEGEELFAHRLDTFVAELHHAGADLHGVGAQENELRGILAGLDPAQP